MKHRAEEASDVAREVLLTSLNNSQETIRNSYIAISTLKATIKENDADLAEKQQALDMLSKIAQHNRDNYKASSDNQGVSTQNRHSIRSLSEYYFGKYLRKFAL